MRNPSLAAAALVFCVLTAPFAVAQVRLTEVQFDLAGTDFGNQSVELHNASVESYDLSGHWLYFPPASYRFPSGVSVEGGQTLMIHLNRFGSASPDVLYTGIGGLRSLQRNDAIGLYRKSFFDDPTTIVDFVRWGDPGSFPQAGEEVAVAAGIWTDGDFVDVTVHRPGCSIARIGDHQGSSAWCIDGTASPGAIETACSFPRVNSSLRVNEIGPGDGPGAGAGARVELIHAGTIPEDVGGYWLVFGTSSFQLPSPFWLAGGNLVVVHFGSEGESDENDIYAGADAAGPDLAQPGSLALFAGDDLDDASWLADFVQWGVAGQDRESMAVSAGIWPAGEAVDTAGRRDEGSLAVFGEGDGSGRWRPDNSPTIGLPNESTPERRVVINEVLVQPSGAGSQAIELHNLTGDAVAFGGYTVCVEPREERTLCYSFADGETLAAGGFRVLWLNSSAAGVDIHRFTGPFRDLNPNGDAIALYAAADTANSWNLVDYFRWGQSDANTLEDVAVEAGLWESGDSFDIGNLAPGTSIYYLGTGTGSTRFRLDSSPSIGRPNDGDSRVTLFSRGDCNVDGILDLTDAIFMLTFLFLGGEEVLCEDACDFNDDTFMDISDALGVLGFKFLGTDPPAEPRVCGEDPPDDLLSCETYSHCGI